MGNCILLKCLGRLKTRFQYARNQNEGYEDYTDSITTSDTVEGNGGGTRGRSRLSRVTRRSSLDSVKKLKNRHGHVKDLTSRTVQPDFSKDAASPPPPPPLVPDQHAVYKLVEQGKEEDVCPICLEEYSEENPCIASKCHVFHLQCGLAWKERSPYCPICAKKLIFIDFQDD